MHYQEIIETFFCLLGRFDFDRAKSYIDAKREVMQRSTLPSLPNQVQFMTMLTTFSHLSETEKNYHNQPFVNQPTHSFLPTTNFLKKGRSLKNMYSDILSELQQLENLEISSTGKKKESSSNQHINISDAPNPMKFLPKLSLKGLSSSNATSATGSATVIENNCDIRSDQRSQLNLSSTDRETSSGSIQVPQSPGSTLRNSFFRVLSPISSTSSIPSQQTLYPSDPYSLSSSSGYEPPPNSATTTPVTPVSNLRDFSEELILHFCSQLQTFIQARLDMVDVYELLVENSSKKYSSVEGIAFRLSMLCRHYHKYFHHPFLAPIKEGMTLECESLMTLIRATIDMQHWRFLQTLFDLQDAQSKLSYWAASTFNKESSRRRFKVSKTQAAPRLYDWLCRFKDFLVSKFTLYFHATLSKNFPQMNFKSCCSKLPIDYYGRLASFQRKIDALFVALLYDVSNEKDFKGLGYNFPAPDQQQPQGKSTLQSMVVIPNEGKAKLSSLQAEIYMIIMSNSHQLIKDGYYQFHDNIKRLTYSLTKPDQNVLLVVVCEGHKADRDNHIRSVLLEITNQFASLNIFTT